MKVTIFSRGIDSHSRMYEQAFAEGLRSHGHDIRFHPWHNKIYHHIDMGVIWGINNHLLVKHLDNVGIPLVVLERGYIGNRKEWTSCGFDGLNGRANFNNKHSDSRRLHHISDYVKPIKKVLGDYNLLVGQVASDASVKHINYHRWLDDAAKTIKKTSRNTPLYFRPHPLEKEPHIPTSIDKVLIGTLEKAIDGARCVYSFNSNVGVDCTLAGVNHSCADEGSMVYKVNLSQRRQWFKNMSYTQWRLSEMKSGETWNHLKGAIGK